MTARKPLPTSVAASQETTFWFLLAVTVKAPSVGGVTSTVLARAVATLSPPVDVARIFKVTEPLIAVGFAVQVYSGLVPLTEAVIHVVPLVVYSQFDTADSSSIKSALKEGFADTYIADEGMAITALAIGGVLSGPVDAPFEIL